MKKYFLLLLLSVMSLSLFAQETREFKSVVGISPFRLLSGLRIKYEMPLNEKIACGSFLTGYYGSTPGVQLAPFARYYFKAKAPEGFYAQAKILGGFYSRDITVDIYDGTYNSSWQTPIETENRKQTFTSFGAGIAAGYQLLWGKDNRWTIDINLGLKFVGAIPNPTLKDNENVFEIDNLGWFTVGPGSIVDGLISIGYRF